MGVWVGCKDGVFFKFCGRNDYGLNGDWVEVVFCGVVVFNGIKNFFVGIDVWDSYVLICSGICVSSLCKGIGEGEDWVGLIVYE